ncbi:P-loop ATPase, Sll1717 family [Caulobacter hibisci]|uniref:CD-NTase-associated protein 12/Pycsar effector protein TIR domain-containing protein n=1 Tax=Caulobacter hibisci TaxID=2035993 RepID=A0ABS0SXI6_9CAUL|nr:hypothetical protein [Caulobacter hibisci]MBI1683625.1 hypothetical protein [Caulobacter hibisci]
MSDKRSAFYAFPSNPAEVGQSIHSAKGILAQRAPDMNLHLWLENDISGRALTDPIFQKISEADYLVADITALNFNVTFEIGYAIGLGKRIFLTRSKVFSRQGELANRIGIFDTLGFQEYANEQDLATLLAGTGKDGALPIGTKVNSKAPIYVLQTPVPSQAMLAITGRIKKSRFQYKGFLPQEEPRLSAVKAVDDISAALGVVVPLLPADYQDAEVHNIRAAFAAGVAIGLGKATLILQPVGGPAPLDVRDLVKSYKHPDEIGDHIAELALQVTERIQEVDPLPITKGNLLAELSIGDPTAENELQTLAAYYVRTDQYGRASRGEVNMVVGRKGAGKTALFWQLTNQKRSNVQNIVVDLKPQGYQLIRLKEDVLDFLAEGARNHLITAFFEYVLFLEIAYKLLEKDKDKHIRDGRLYKPYQALNEVYRGGDAGEGDFSERLLNLSQKLASEFKAKRSGESEQRLTAAEVTELVHKNNIREIRSAISDYLEFKSETWVLFDNLDKGWSAQGIGTEDVLILRCLIDAARKVQRELQGDGHEFHCIVFVRNDVYQLLVERSADYGKESRAVLDWSDADLLREMMRRRLVRNGIPENTPFERVWSEICLSHYEGEETSQYFIERSLMRPRNLLKILGHALGFAVNLNRARIEEADIEKGMRAYSLDLITEADQELTDILGKETNLIYHFIGEGVEFRKDKLEALISSAGIDGADVLKVIEFLLYFGFIGVRIRDAEPKYIYTVGYDMKMLKVLIEKAGDAVVYLLNPAFHPGLN